MSTTTSWHIDTPGPEHREVILRLFPRLATFELPSHREPQHLWKDDADLFEQWCAGDAPHVRVLVARDDDASLAGVAMFSLGPEKFNGEPSAHLEALAVSDGHEGRGVGSALIDACHARARDEGARSMTLHVFDNNRRARQLYQRKGYATEVLRCVKWL